MSKIAATRFPEAEVVCCEPAPEIFTEAERNLAGMGNVTLDSTLEKLPRVNFDYVFCLRRS